MHVVYSQRGATISAVHSQNIVVAPKVTPWPPGRQPRPPACFSHQCLCPTGCLAKAWCPSVTTSAGTSSGESWTWPSAAGERGPAGQRGSWLGRAVLGWWAGEREGLIQAAGTEGGGRPVGREAERGPYRFVDIRVVTRTSGCVGVPVPQELPRRRPHHSHLGFLFYYSFHFGVTFDFLSNSHSDTIHIPRNSPICRVQLNGFEYIQNLYSHHRSQF